MAYEDIVLTVDPDGVATIELNRPDKRNAMRLQSYAELTDALHTVIGDTSIRALLVTGRGKGFCAGDDFSDIFTSDTKDDWQKDRRVGRLTGPGLNELVDAFMRLEIPTVAAVNGAAVGAGMDLAILCDIRYASERGRFGSFFVRRGIAGTIGGTYFLRQLVGLSNALELLLTGDLIDAQTAREIGLVSKVLPAEELLPAANALAQRLAQGAPLAQRAIKRIVRKGLTVDWRTLDEYSDAISDVLWETEDHMEGVQSFLEQRPAQFRGR
jgi:enoyl-CoA hydratase/carnithine racemase